MENCLLPVPWVSIPRRTAATEVLVLFLSECWICRKRVWLPRACPVEQKKTYSFWYRWLTDIKEYQKMTWHLTSQRMSEIWALNAWHWSLKSRPGASVVDVAHATCCSRPKATCDFQKCRSEDPQPGCFIFLLVWFWFASNHLPVFFWAHRSKVMPAIYNNVNNVQSFISSRTTLG